MEKKINWERRSKIVINIYLSMVILNINRCCSNQMLQLKNIEWQIGLKKEKPTIGCLQDTLIRAKDKYRLNVRERKWK